MDKAICDDDDEADRRVGESRWHRSLLPSFDGDGDDDDAAAADGLGDNGGDNGGDKRRYRHPPELLAALWSSTSLDSSLDSTSSSESTPSPTTRAPMAMADVEFVIVRDRRSIHAHRVVLEARANAEFMARYGAFRWQERVEVADDVRYEVFHALLAFYYLGRVEIPETPPLHDEFLALARSLKLEFGLRSLNIPSYLQNSRIVGRDLLQMLNVPPGEIPKYSDVRVVVLTDGGAETYHLHKCILISRSDYFRVMFSSSFRDKDATEIKVEDVSPAIFKLFVTYIYCGDVDVNVTNAHDLYALADMYQVPDLQRKIVGVMYGRICGRFESSVQCFTNIPFVLTLASTYSIRFLMGKCLQKIAQCPAQVITKREFGLLDAAIIENVFAHWKDVIRKDVRLCLSVKPATHAILANIPSRGQKFLLIRQRASETEELSNELLVKNFGEVCCHEAFFQFLDGDSFNYYVVQDLFKMFEDTLSEGNVCERYNQIEAAMTKLRTSNRDNLAARMKNASGNQSPCMADFQEVTVNFLKQRLINVSLSPSFATLPEALRKSLLKDANFEWKDKRVV